jgi:hypothetical protein
MCEERRRGIISPEKPKNGERNGKESHATRLLQMYIFFSQETKILQSILQYCSKETDGRRLRSHQCSSTSFSPPVIFLKSSNSFFKRIRATPTILCCLMLIGIQVLPNLSMRFLLPNGRWCYAVLLRIRNRYAQSLTIMGCPMKPSGEPFLLRVSRVKQDKSFLLLPLLS